MRLPPHIGWPLFVVAILMVGVGGVTATVIASRSDGGAQVVDDYYRRAATWDEIRAVERASAALGWQVTVTVAAAESPALRPVEIGVLDRDGGPVAGLRGFVRVSRPHRSGPVAEIPLAPLPGRPGVYRQLLPLAAAGLWDFEIDAARGAERFVRTLRHEIADGGGGGRPAPPERAFR